MKTDFEYEKFDIIEAIIPVRILDDGPSEDWSIFENAIQEIESLSNRVEIPVYNNETVLVLIDRLTPSEIRTTKLNLVEYFFGEVLRFRVEYSSPNLPPSLIERRLFDILNIFNIARPGWFGFSEGILKAVNSTHKNELLIGKTPLWGSEMKFAIEHANKVKWPNILELDIKKTWDWYFKVSNCSSDVSKSAIERSINAYSHLYNNDLQSYSEDLFWALLGIEAIYLENKHGIQNEINKKTQIVLGERVEYKKLFNEMYLYRSQFVHGSANFPNKVSVEKTPDNYYEHLDRIGKAKDTAIAILIATLQVMSKNNWSQLKFDYIMKL